MTEIISYKVMELELERVNWYFEMILCVFFCIIGPLGGGGLFYIIYFLIYSRDWKNINDIPYFSFYFVVCCK
jgi:hypothetical protein